MRYLSIAAWLDAAYRLPCLDVRGEEAFQHRHLIGAGNVPLDQIAERIHELPRKGGEIFVVGGEVARGAAELLDARGRWRVAWSDEDLSAQEEQYLCRDRSAPLWRPNAWLEEHVGEITAGGRVFDVAMGSGRNAVFMALRGFQISGEDILPEAVVFAKALARRHGVTLDARLGDLRRDDPLGGGLWDGVMVFNYLDRRLLPRLAEALAPGGVLVYETFTEDQGRLVGRPANPQWLLKPRELLSAFSDLDVLAYREGSPEEDRHVASLVARKRA